MATDMEIDDSLYSRQRYVFGDNAMQRMALSSVLVYGQGGLGVEIAKNIALAGVKSLTIQDPQTVKVTDLGTQFFLREKDVTNNRNRAEACADHLSQLNPYVKVETLTTLLDENSDLSYLSKFQCVVLTETSLTVMIKVNEFCRSQNPAIKFIAGDVFGVFCSSFCDFGEEFEVVDDNGKEPQEIFIASITKANPGIVECQEHTLHHFTEGDMITFREIRGMEALNGKQCQIKVISDTKFSICDTSGAEFLPYQRDGIATQIKLPTTAKFKSLNKEITDPTITLIPDNCKLRAPACIHLTYLALKQFQEQKGRLPGVRCSSDARELFALVCEKNKSMKSPIGDIDSEMGELLQTLSFCSQGVFPPLCATLGGILAQEALKSVTGKFMPIRQWFHLDAVEVIGSGNDDQFNPKGDRYDSLRCCIGDELLGKLTSLRVFMVGCGAIGCEMLKNYALLGIGTGENGQVTITDNDLIEKSNLNRQFLFRPHHIQQPKSSTAKQSTLEINPCMSINAQQDTVCPQTESTVYTDKFFEDHHICVNALDNLEARRYMDSRCITNQRPLLESGTIGPKGHVQVIVPHVTETYADCKDPVESGIPYCTLKSFPANIEHCIQWSREKFESSFTQKPKDVKDFIAKNEKPAVIIEKLKEGKSVDGAIRVSKVLKHQPDTWANCVKFGRLKFEKYFNHRAKQLLYSYPPDSKLENGSFFWQSPKRPPIPVEFNQSNELHLKFVCATARLYAKIGGVANNDQDLSKNVILSSISGMEISPFKESEKTIITDQSVTKANLPPIIASGDALKQSALRLESFVSGNPAKFNEIKMSAVCFEKDDDTNGHIDFISSAANLRAAMYNIEPADPLKAKKIAGRIIPAIVTTTATVSGLVTIELIKVIKGCPIDKLKNCMFDLALPWMQLCKPGASKTKTGSKGVEFTPWDKWEVHGNPEMTLKQLLDYFKEMYDTEVTSVVMGRKPIYIACLGHATRHNQLMSQLLKPASEGQEYVDLVAMSKRENDVMTCPSIRYFFHR